MLDRIPGGHFELPLAGFAVAGDEVRVHGLDLVEQRFADGLGGLVVLLLEAVGARDAAAVGVQHGEFHARDHLQKLRGKDAPAQPFQVARRVVGDPAPEVFFELECRRAGFQQLPDVTGREEDGIPDAGVIDLQEYVSPALQADSLLLSHWGSPSLTVYSLNIPMKGQRIFRLKFYKLT